MVRRYAAGIVLALALDCVTAGAQVSKVGSVDIIKGLRLPLKCGLTESANPPSAALNIIRGRDAVPTVAGKGDSILVLDRLAMRSSADARLDITSNQFGTGAFILAPALGLCAVPDYQHFHGVSLKGTEKAKYEIGSRVDSSGALGLVLSIEHGAAAIQWDSGKPLYVIARGKTLHVTGTAFAVIDDSATARGYLFVGTGEVAFLEDSGVVATREQLYGWTRDGPPELISPLPQGFKKDYAFHANQIWLNPNPNNDLSWLKILGGSAMIFGVTYVLPHALDNAPAARSGRVSLRLPF